jgi:mannosidase alpha-like ER degradation enhancer 2
VLVFIFVLFRKRSGIEDAHERFFSDDVGAADVRGTDSRLRVVGLRPARDHRCSGLGSVQAAVLEMFYHAYDGYMRHGYPLDELRPLSCDGVDTWGSYSLTLIDALGTLAVVGNYSEFRRVAGLLVTGRKNFEANINVSVFETNIRIVGGLLSAHLMARRAGMELDPGWPCRGPLLDLAVDAARRLLPAFDTPTGMPYGTVNLRYGVTPGETPFTCTASVCTIIAG